MMEKWDWQRMEQNSREAKQAKIGHHRQNHRSRNPSFSSALLDAICKSTEDDQGRISYSRDETRSTDNNNHDKMWSHSSSKRSARLERETQGKPRRSAEIGGFNAEKFFSSHEIESLGGSNAFQSFCQTISSAASCSSETSDNTSNWPYSSSDAESLYRPAGKCSATKTARNSAGREEKARKWASCMARGRECSEDFLSVKDEGFRSAEPFMPEEITKSKKKSKFQKESKKPKQPISPGGRLASFLNSLFMPGSTKKAKLSTSSSVSESNSYYFSQKKAVASASASVCSSSSSAQRSCLSKTSSSRGRPNGTRRSVTFYPTSIAVDDCSLPYSGRMEIPTALPNPVANPYLSPSTEAFKVNEKLKVRILEKTNQAPSAEDIMAKYHKANSILEAVARELRQDDDEEDDDDDATSCSSSDLFELENLATVDISMFQKELPVYETTHLETNKAIAKGLIV